ncbi:LCP family protein [Modestobacter sp. VKM Ac-2979]|uniref:LCP family protein n=1 Tax=unclassified Modestobacter TaxID=2643866 RepID=UPI0022AB7221|nr:MULTISPECIES: LCP family protein [unclassified Modestobacter]MCZ2812678.1 LCP family protein [Modestobacter sp. VKM Ac-2979]MCZ2841568.1 LCP family protein [Modestobacter sp. VKM Ac-2980]
MTLPHDVDAGQETPGRRPPRSRTRARRWALVVLSVLALLVVALGADAAVLAGRLEQVDVDLSDGPGDADGRTWVLVGLDSRTNLPTDAASDAFGTPEDVPGSRADVVVVVHQTDAGATVFSVPRDVVVRTDRRPGRLALTWLRGPQATVEGLCQLGIPTDHLLTVDLGGFAAVVDAAGGLDVDVPEPVRDQPAGLELTRSGHQHVDGATALALVRSRHPEHLVDGEWVPAPAAPDGRATAAGSVLAALMDQVRATTPRPWRLQSVAWAASAAIATDPDTSVGELTSLARADVADVRVLPVGDPVGGTIARLPTADTTAAIASAGLSCSR